MSPPSSVVLHPRPELRGRAQLSSAQGSCRSTSQPARLPASPVARDRSRSPPPMSTPLREAIATASMALN
eukprot:2148378-Alexandrium_andersonii.AAC.1